MGCNINLKQETMKMDDSFNLMIPNVMTPVNNIISIMKKHEEI